MKNNFLVIAITFLILSETLIFDAGITSAIAFVFVLVNYKIVRLKYYKVIIPLIVIFAIGLITAREYDYVFYKDCWYFIKPIVYFMAGVTLIKYYKSTLSLNNMIILMAIIFSIVGTIVLFKLSMVGEIVSQSMLIESNFHLSYLIFYAIVLIGYKKYDNKYINKFGTLIIIFLLIFLIFTFSRTLLASFIILIFAITISLKSTKKYLLRIGFAFLIMFVFLVFSDFEIFSTFTNKFSLSFSELEFTKTAYNIGEVSNWRGYESLVAFETITNNANIFSYLLGKGFGTTIDLGFTTQLAKGFMRDIGLLHNGYLELILKTGLIGVFLYILFLFNFYRSFSTLKNKNYSFEKGFAAGLIIIILINTYTSTGLYSYQNCDTTIFILGFYLTFLKKMEDKTINSTNL